MSLMHVKSTMAGSLPFTFFKAEQYTSSRVQNVGCVYYCCCSYYAAARYTWKSRVGCGKLRLTSSNSQTPNPHLRQMQESWWYLLYKQRYSPFCLKFCCHGNKGRSG